MSSIKSRIRPPWIANKTVFPRPRKSFIDGVWDYAIGRPAHEHASCAKAIRSAAHAGWNPWWIRSYADVSAVLSGCWFDEPAGLRVCRFLEKLVLSKGKFRNKPMSLMDWQRYHLTMPLYGWKNADDTRRFTKAGVWIPKKNGKSGWSSGVALYHLRGDVEGAPYVWVGAVDRTQAGIIHDESARMVRLTPDLKKDLVCVNHKKRISYPASDGVLEALSADIEQKEGIDWSFGVIDELHVGSSRMYSTLAGGGAARSQPLMVTISTAGVYDPTSIGWEQWEYARKIREGVIEDNSFFALQYYADEGAEIDDWAQIERANPSLGIVLNESFLRDRIREAKNSPGKAADFRRYHMNGWVNAAHGWLGAGRWDACHGGDYRDTLDGRTCFGGLDLSLTEDITAFALAFPPDDTCSVWRSLELLWVPGGAVSRRAVENRAPYEQWIADGWLRTTPGDVLDYDAVGADIVDACAKYNLRSVFYDPRFVRQSMITDVIESHGIEAVVWANTAKNMSPGVIELERLIGGRLYEHCGNPVMAWMVSNCQAIQVFGAPFLVKSESRAGRVRHKIDGVVALVMALQSAAHAEQQPVVTIEGLGG